MAEEYPTWRMIRRGVWESEEQIDGVPDYRLDRLKRGAGWLLDSRRSARVDRFPTRKAAMDSLKPLVPGRKKTNG